MEVARQWREKERQRQRWRDTQRERQDGEWKAAWDGNSCLQKGKVGAEVYMLSPVA